MESREGPWFINSLTKKKTRRESKRKERVSFCVILGEWAGDEKINKQRHCFPPQQVVK
jgi:hypothetical protein